MNNTIILKGTFYERAEDNRRHCINSGDGQFLFYCALELRMGIERYLFAWVTMISSNINKNIESKYSSKDLNRYILSLEPQFITKVKFAKAHARACQMPLEINVPDLDQLNSLYGRLGGYLHCVKRPSKTVESSAWWNQLLLLLSEAIEVVKQLTSGPFYWPELNEKGKVIYDKFLNNELTESELVKLLQFEQLGG